MAPLGRQDRAGFHSGDVELDRYFHERASRDVREKLSAVFVLLAEENLAQVLGYYTLSALQIDAGEVPDVLKKRAGRYRYLGATLLGRLAVAQEHQGKRMGELLLMDALRRSWEASKTVMSFAVLVDAKNEQVAKFYEKFGFVRLSGNRLMLPMKSIEMSFGGRG